MNVLSNLPFPSSEKITFHLFGRNAQGPLFYDYQTVFPEFLNRLKQVQSIDALFFYYPEYNAIPPKMEEVGIPLVALVSDWNLGFFPLYKNLLRFDWIVADKKGCEVFRSLGYSNVVHWNLYGYKPEEWIFSGTVQKSCDILFIGNANPAVQKERNLFLERVLSLSDRFKVRVETHIRGTAYSEALRSAKVVFNRSIRGEVNMRVFEALAAETLVFLESGNLEIRELLSPEDECVLYEDADLEERLAFFVTHDADRERRIRNASLKKRNLSYPALLDQLHDKLINAGLREKPTNNRRIMELLPHERHFHEALQGFYATMLTPDIGYRTQAMQMALGDAPDGRSIGLLHFSIYTKVKGSTPLADEERTILLQLPGFIRARAQGRMLNYFNHARVLEAAGLADAEKDFLSEATAILSRETIQLEEWDGVLCMFVNEDFYPEINRWMYQGTSTGLDETRKVLLGKLLTRRGILAFNSEDMAGAAVFLDKAVGACKDLLDARYMKASVYLVRDPVVGLRELKAAFALNPFHPQVWGDLLAVLIALHRYQEALDCLHKIRAMMPLSRQIYGYTLEEIDDLEARCKKGLGGAFRNSLN